MSPAVRALRGATTVDADTPEQVRDRTVALVDRMMADNGIDHDDLISVLFTATDDIHSMFPALAARESGLGDVPLMCARELDIRGAKPLCIRILMHMSTTRERDELHHIYLEGAADLRDDLPG
ncbi:MAG: chorismate mutase [Acidimicrobiales bacterium]